MKAIKWSQNFSHCKSIETFPNAQGQLTPLSEVDLVEILSFFMPPTLEGGDILVSACPYVCMHGASRYRLETSCMDSSWKNS